MMASKTSAPDAKLTQAKRDEERPFQESVEAGSRAEMPDRCPNCGNRSFRFDSRRSELVCERCGFVIESPSPDATQYDEGSGVGSSVRRSSSVLRADRGLGRRPSGSAAR